MVLSTPFQDGKIKGMSGGKDTGGSGKAPMAKKMPKMSGKMKGK